MSKFSSVFIGIDLGTTNSSASWGTEDRKNVINIRPVPIDMVTDVGGEVERKELLPSVVFYPMSQTNTPVQPIVGPYAKKMIRTSPLRVVRSVKLKMGTDWKFRVDKSEYTPVEISGLILETLVMGIRQHLRLTGKVDAVITVPASFNSNQRQATLQAAERAGIRVINDDGTPRDILIDEPRASLYDLLNTIQSGDFPYNIDFSKEKTVLVYDFGGGTLDVSLHKVTCHNGNEPPIVVDLGLSRFTELGGDVFDKELMEHEWKRYLEQYSIDESKESKDAIEAAKRKLLLYTEQLKINLSNAYEQQSFMNRGEKVDYGKIRENVQPGFLIGMHPLSTEMTLQEYRAVIAHLLADGTEYPTRETIEKIVIGRDVISPVLDVIKKVFIRTGELVKPELVLLAGGMNRFCLIKDRITRFFNQKPISTQNPERTVSRGASVYHWYFSKGYKATNITAEALYMGTGGDATQLLVPEGIPLPYDSQERKFKTSGPNLTKRIPLYNDPDRKQLITNLRYTLSSMYPAGTRVVVHATVDSRKLLTFRAWLRDTPSEKLQIQLELDKIRNDEELIESDEEQELPKPPIEEKKPQPEIVVLVKPIQAKPSATPAVKPTYIPKNLTEEEIRTKINTMLLVWVKTGKYSVQGLRSYDIPHLDGVNKAVMHLTYLYRHGLNKNKDTRLKLEINRIIGEILDSGTFNEHPKRDTTIDLIVFKIAEDFEYHSKRSDLSSDYYQLLVPSQLTLLGKCKKISMQKDIISILIEWMSDPKFINTRPKILATMGQLPPDNRLVTFLVEFLKKDQTEHLLAAALAALGKQGSRKEKNPVFHGRYDEISGRLFDLFERWWHSNVGIVIVKVLASLFAYDRSRLDVCCDDRKRKEIGEGVKRMITLATTERFTPQNDLERVLNLRKSLELLPMIISGETADIVDEDKYFMNIQI